MTDRRCQEHESPSYESELNLASRLLEEGDRAHALHHVVGALAREPNRREWHVPLRELSSDAVFETKLRDDRYFGAVAARAFALRDAGALAEAIALIADVHASVPHVGFHAWLAAWAEEAREKGVKLEWLPLARALQVGVIGVGRMHLLPSEKRVAEELAPFARLAAEVTDNRDLALLACSVLRRAGRFEEAIAMAERASDAGDHRYLVLRGLARRGARQFDGALDDFRQAVEKTRDPIHRHEQFRVLVDAGRWSEALLVMVEFRATDSLDDEARLALAFVERAAEENAPPPARSPLDLVNRRVNGHGRLSPMLDATANMLRQLGASPDVRANGPRAAGESLRAAKLKLSVSGYEGPSNRLCLAAMRGSVDVRDVDYTMLGPALRTLSDDVDQYAIWQVDDTGIAVPALPPPNVAVLDFVERIAFRELDGTLDESEFESSTDFLEMWEFANGADRPHAPVREWLAAVVHPRIPLARTSLGPEAIHRWQVAAVLAMATSESGWTGTRRRDALLSLLRGSVDWPLDAAIRVATEVALHEPESLSEIRDRLLVLSEQLDTCSVPNTAIAYTLGRCLAMLPLVSEPYVERVRQWLRAQDEPDSGEAPPAAPAAEKTPDAPKDPVTASPKRPWWKFWS